jgi:hypothetical protein
MAAVLHVVRNALQQRVVGDVERGHDEQLVRREILRLGKDEIRADVQVVERVVHLLHQRGVPSGSPDQLPGGTAPP